MELFQVGPPCQWFSSCCQSPFSNPVGYYYYTTSSKQASTNWSNFHLQRPSNMNSLQCYFNSYVAMGTSQTLTTHLQLSNFINVFFQFQGNNCSRITFICKISNGRTPSHQSHLTKKKTSLALVIISFYGTSVPPTPSSQYISHPSCFPITHLAFLVNRGRGLSAPWLSILVEIAVALSL